jgi:hypothetical protein
VSLAIYISTFYLYIRNILLGAGLEINYTILNRHQDVLNYSLTPGQEVFLNYMPWASGWCIETYIHTGFSWWMSSVTVKYMYVTAVSDCCEDVNVADSL